MRNQDRMWGTLGEGCIRHSTRGQGMSEWAARRVKIHSAIALLMFTLWQCCEDMKLDSGGVVAGPAVIHAHFWQEKQSPIPSRTCSVCLHEAESSRLVCQELPLRSSDCNLRWQNASVGIRSLSVAYSHAPPQCSESSRERACWCSKCRDLCAWSWTDWIIWPCQCL